MTLSSFSQSLPRADLTTRCLAVNGGGSIAECDRLSKPFRRIVICTYLLTYLFIGVSPHTGEI